LSDFINLRSAECVRSYYGLRVCSQTNKKIKSSSRPGIRPLHATSSWLQIQLNFRVQAWASAGVKRTNARFNSPEIGTKHTGYGAKILTPRKLGQRTNDFYKTYRACNSCNVSIFAGMPLAAQKRDVNCFVSRSDELGVHWVR